MSLSGNAEVRPPAVAGTFYPVDRAELGAMVRSLIRDALNQGHRPQQDIPKVIIAPHAGYIYSGPIAASVYARLGPARNRIKRVVLLGPTHRVAVRGLAVPSHAAFQTPLGSVPLDRALINELKRLPQVREFDQTHAAEHSLEVHLPFLQQTFADFRLVPIVVGDAEPNEVAAVLQAAWGGPETLIVISSDLSHYHDYATAQSLDAATSSAITELRLDGVSDVGACGRMPIRGFLLLARQIGMAATAIDVRNSGDTAGPRDRVVGYGAYMFSGGDERRLRALNFASARATPPPPSAAAAPPPMTAPAAPRAPAAPPVQPAQTATASSAAPRPDPAIARSERGYASGLSDDLRRSLLNVAARSIMIGLRSQQRPKLDLETFHADLRQPGASFITLTMDGRLRGCIGSLEARRPLVADVAANAYASAFEDRRFKVLSHDEFGRVLLSISVLSEPAALRFCDENDLLGQLVPGRDGLIIQDGTHRATFLPQVWEQTQDPREFMKHLKLKAGLAENHWSANFRAWRYHTESFTRLPQPPAPPA